MRSEGARDSIKTGHVAVIWRSELQIKLGVPRCCGGGGALCGGRRRHAAMRRGCCLLELVARRTPGQLQVDGGLD